MQALSGVVVGGVERERGLELSHGSYAPLFCCQVPGFIGCQNGGVAVLQMIGNQPLPHEFAGADVLVVFRIKAGRFLEAGKSLVILFLLFKFDSTLEGSAGSLGVLFGDGGVTLGCQSKRQDENNKKTHERKLYSEMRCAYERFSS